MLQIKSLTIEHRRDLRVILENFNLVLNTGDKAVIIGEEGNGKSTLLKWIFDPALVAAYAAAGAAGRTEREIGLRILFGYGCIFRLQSEGALGARRTLSPVTGVLLR